MKQHRFDKDFRAIMEAVNDVYYGKAIQDMTPDEIHAQQEMLEKGESTKKSSMLKKAADAIGQAVADFKQGQKDATTAKEKPKTDKPKSDDDGGDKPKPNDAPKTNDAPSGSESPKDPTQPKGKEKPKGSKPSEKPKTNDDSPAKKPKKVDPNKPKPKSDNKPKPKAKTEPKTDSKPKPKAEPKPETKPKADSAQDRERKKKTSFASKVRSTAKGVKAGVSGAADVNVKQGVKWGKNAYKADQRKEIKRNLKKKKK